jgi:hypothetical protein
MDGLSDFLSRLREDHSITVARKCITLQFFTRPMHYPAAQQTQAAALTSQPVTLDESVRHATVKNFVKLTENIPRFNVNQLLRLRWRR